MIRRIQAYLVNELLKRGLGAVPRLLKIPFDEFCEERRSR